MLLLNYSLGGGKVQNKTKVFSEVLAGFAFLQDHSYGKMPWHVPSNNADSLKQSNLKNKLMCFCENHEQFYRCIFKSKISAQ